MNEVEICSLYSISGKEAALLFHTLAVQLREAAGGSEMDGRTRFTSTVRPLEGTIFVGTQLTPLGAGTGEKHSLL